MAFNKEKVMDSARKFVEKNQIDKAVKEYLRIVQEDPKDVRVWLKIGDLYAKKGAKQDATDTYLKVARFYQDQGFVDKAIAVYNQILKLDPRLVGVIMQLADLYRQRGKLHEAMQHYEAVAAHFHREGNTKEALETVKKLVDLEPENIATRIKLAELYSKEGLVDDAVVQFTEACEQLRRQNRQDDFIKVAERLLWHKPELHALNRELAGLYLRRNDPRRALQKLQASFKADSRDVETLGLLALAFQALDQRAKTVSVLKELARVYIENKAKDKAGEVYRKILEIVPNDADAIAFVGPQAPPTPQPPPRPTPNPRAGTQGIPNALRAITGDAKFNITSDLPAIPQRNTGSLPLVDEESLSGVDFALPEYDDADFSADMEPPPDPRRASAAGERHAEEISKILAETDVYVKYGLHQKAIDHLRRVFTLDGDNVEAHERLKEIFISQGREQEAEAELLKLAELVAPNDPDRAEQYLQDLLAMNGTHTGAFELARRFQLRVARMSSVSAEVDYGRSGSVAEIEGDGDELDLEAPPRHGAAIAVQAARRDSIDSIDDFDPDELIGHDRMAHGSPTPARPPRRPASEAFAVELDPSPSSPTRQLPSEQIEALAQMPADSFDGLEEDSAVLVDRPSMWARAGEYDGSVDDAVADQLDDADLAEEIDAGMAHELEPHAHDQGDDLPFDPDEARRFDAAVAGKGATDAVYVSGFEETDMPPPHVEVDDGGYDPLAVAGSYDPYGGTESVPRSAEHTAQGAPAPEHDLDRAESLVEDDLDEADFYAQQGMYPEALNALHALLERYPSHRLILAKMHEIEAAANGELAQPIDTPPAGQDVDAVQHVSIDISVGTDAIELDELEEVSESELDIVDEGEAPKGKRKPTVMLEKPVDEGDAETHYDLGLAYKEMGLYDEAIKAFEKVLRAPGREVQCRVMLGMCQREQGNPNEAIHEFKQGLYANASDREKLSLFYEIGITYESMGDTGEALYYFESVVKRDPSFADAGRRVEALRARGGRATPPSDEI